MLIFEGYSTRFSSETTKFVDKYYTMLCLLSHTTHYVQSLVRSYFKSPKARHCEAVRRWVYSNNDSKNNLFVFGELLKRTTYKKLLLAWSNFEISD
jgi:predicted component of type VI protein secretion system